MNYNEFIIYSALGSHGYWQYQQNMEVFRAIQAAEEEQKQKERRAKWSSIGSIMLQSIEPTVEFVQKWQEVDSKHPNVKRCIITGEYALNMGKIAYDEHVRLVGK